MGETTLKDLLEAGVHFGHQTKRWNPKMKPFLFAEKNGINYQLVIGDEKVVGAFGGVEGMLHARVLRTGAQGSKQNMVTT